jgi:hypothetical protein
MRFTVNDRYKTPVKQLQREDEWVTSIHTVSIL